MRNLESELLFFKSEINKKFIQENIKIKDGDITNLVLDSPFSLNKEEKNYLIKNLESNIVITQKIGSVVKSDHKPWVQQLRRERSDPDFWFFSKRLESFWLSTSKSNGLPLKVISRINNETDDILDYCGNPNDKYPWSRRGMVMGHVQSGKTTNYSSLICKAADVGYKIIIILCFYRFN